MVSLAHMLKRVQYPFQATEFTFQKNTFCANHEGHTWSRGQNNVSFHSIFISSLIKRSTDKKGGKQLCPKVFLNRIKYFCVQSVK